MSAPLPVAGAPWRSSGAAAPEPRNATVIAPVALHPASPAEASAWPTRGSPPAIYTDPGFLQLLARVYFPRKACQVQDCAVGSQVFRLLVVRGHGPVTTQTFIDFHEPLREVGEVGHGGRVDSDEQQDGPKHGPKHGLHQGLLHGLRHGPHRQALPRGPRLNFAVRGVLDVGSFTRLNEPAPPPWLQGGAPALLWRDFPDWDSYLALLRRRRTLAEDQRRRRRLTQAVGTLHFAPDDLASDVLPTCIAWKSARDREAGRPELFAQPAHQAFFHQLRRHGLLRASTLRDGDGHLLAVWLGAVHRERWTGWVFAFRPEERIARYSPGRQLLYDMLEHSHAEGHREFDFSIGLEPYKLGFATHVRLLGPAGSPTLRERLAAATRRLRDGWSMASRGDP